MARTAPVAKDSTVITKDYSVVDDPSSIVAKNYSVVDDPSWIASSVAKDYSVVDDPSSIASSVAKVKPSHGLHGNGLKRGPPMDMVDHL
jgi:archaellum component FlaG (FlaF/FlaG flagellin family)